MVTPIVRLLLAGLAGAAWGLCFGRQPLGLAPWLALAPLALLLGQPHPGRSGFAHGLAAWLVSVPWLVPTLVDYGYLPVWLSRLLVVLLGGYLALFTTLFALLGARLWRRGGWRLAAGLPALWVALEWLRGHLFTGFPWNLAAYAAAALPGVLPLAAWVGAYGISFLVVVTGVCSARALAARRWRVAVVPALAVLLVAAVAARFAVPPAGAEGGGRPLAVRLLQPNVPNLTEWDGPLVEANYRKVLDLSRRACDEPGALVVWPESAGWPFRFDHDPGFRADLAALAQRGCPVLFNTPFDGPGGVFNSAILMTAEGVAGRYDKRHLVPWGEYVPLKRWLPFVGKLARSAGDFTAGDAARTVPWGDERLGPAICFEVIFPAEVAAQVAAGATLLVTVTNDAWYGDTAAPWQHFRAARFRAAENGRYLLRAAITGVSGVIAPDGSLVARLGVGEEGVLSARVEGRRGLTPYSRAPWLVPAVCTLLAALAIFLPLRREP